MSASTLVIQAAIQSVMQTSAAIPDTIVAITVPESSFLRSLGTVASAILALAVLIIAIAIGVAGWQIRAVASKVIELLDHIKGETGPLSKQATLVVSDVRDITQKVKSKVDDVQETVTYANERARDMVDSAGDRIAQMNALLKAMQDEADAAFVKSVSTMRGVRKGIKTAFQHPGDDEADNASRISRQRTHGPRVKPKSEIEYEEDESR